MESSSSGSLLRHLTSLLLLIQLSTQGSTEEFLVKGPSQSIVAELGGNIMVPCSLYPAMNAENMELRWFRSQISDVVFVYQNQQEQKEEQMPQYAGRTSLVKDLLAFGEAAVKIDKVQVSDDGQYTCFFKKGNFYEKATLELKVAGMGSTPEVKIQGPKEDGVQVVCMSSGWFPKPLVQWRDFSGKKFLVFSEVHTQDMEGLFHVEASLVVRDKTSGNVTCSILNPILAQEKAKAIFIPEPFFPQTSFWIPAFFVSISILGILIFGIVYFTKKEHSAKLREQKECKNLEQSTEEDRKIRDEAMKTRDELQAELDRKKEIYRTAWRKAQLYADWRKEQFQPWSVTLDPCSAHPDLAFSQENRMLTWKYLSKNSDYKTCSVLGLQGISSGLYYWEVEVINAIGGTWTVGVCREDVARGDFFIECPERGFWTVGQHLTGFYACTSPEKWLTLRQTPWRVGVFLDHDGKDLSFYNMTDGSHIFSFSDVSSSGTLFPYFKFESYRVRIDMSLTICPIESVSKGFPVLNKSSLAEPLSPLGKRLSSGSCDDTILPGAKSPLLSHNGKAMST